MNELMDDDFVIRFDSGELLVSTDEKGREIVAMSVVADVTMDSLFFLVRVRPCCAVVVVAVFDPNGWMDACMATILFHNDGLDNSALLNINHHGGWQSWRHRCPHARYYGHPVAVTTSPTRTATTTTIRACLGQHSPDFFLVASS